LCSQQSDEQSPAASERAMGHSGPISLTLIAQCEGVVQANAARAG
jgi:hypothetical protein